MLGKALKKLAIGYIRVSTESQDDEGDSPDHQAANIRDYILKKGFTPGGIYEEIASATPGKPDARPVFLDAVRAAQNQDAILVVTKVDRLSRSYREVKELIVASGIRVHVVSLNRQVGKTKLLALAKQAEAEGAKISRDTKTVLAKKKAEGVKLGAPRNVLQKATRGSRKQGTIAAWQTVTDIAIFISADPVRHGMSRRELAGALNVAGIKSTYGNAWTKESVTRPLRKARDQLRLEDEPDDAPAGFDDVQFE